MTYYEYIKKNKQALDELQAKGLLRRKAMEYYIIYQHYLNTSGKPMMRLTVTAMRLKITERTVRRAINYMTSKY